MDELISRQAAIKATWQDTGYTDPFNVMTAIRDRIEQLPPAEPKIIYCKDCRRHNKKVGFDENFHTIWKEDACPLASWRGKAQGHEFDYQFCAYGERRTE